MGYSEFTFLLDLFYDMIFLLSGRGSGLVNFLVSFSFVKLDTS